MRHKQLKLSAVLLLVLCLAKLQAQESYNATGGDAISGGGMVSYSVGQVVYNTNTETDGSVAEGVQQPFEISIITAIAGTSGITLNISAYPNPASDYLILKIEEFEISNLSYQLYDVQGKLLQKAKLTASQSTISMENLVPATYFIKVIQENNKEVKTFSIIKK